MMLRIIKTLVGALMLAIGFSYAAEAADVYVREAYGFELSQDQANEVTTAVKQAVRKMPEHNLVVAEELADFILQPSVVESSGRRQLRVEKLKGADVIATASQDLPPNAFSTKGIDNVVETALLNDDIVSATIPRPQKIGGQHTGASDESDFPASDVGDDTSSPADAGTSPSVAGGDVRAPSPAFQREDRMGTFQIGVGPAFGIGMASDQIMYDVNLAYMAPLNERLSVKGFGDANLASGGDANRFLNVGIGAEVMPWASYPVIGGIPYLTADVGYAFTRNKASKTQDAIAVGGGGGFKFAARQVNMDINLHYTYLTAKIENDNPSVLGVRAAVNF